MPTSPPDPPREDEPAENQPEDLETWMPKRGTGFRIVVWVVLGLMAVSILTMLVAGLLRAPR